MDYDSEKSVSDQATSPAPDEQSTQITPVNKDNHKLLLILLITLVLLFFVSVVAILFANNRFIFSKTCEYNGVHYKIGETVSNDSCNSCSCTETGQVACTLIACDNTERPINNLSDNLSEDTSNWKTYRNDEYGFSISYPSDFTVQEIEDNMDMLLFKAQSGEPTDGVQKTLRIYHNYHDYPCYALINKEDLTVQGRMISNEMILGISDGFNCELAGNYYNWTGWDTENNRIEMILTSKRIGDQEEMTSIISNGDILMNKILSTLTFN